MMTWVRGHRSRIIRVASLPFRDGMAISMRTTSGPSSTARRTASRPSATKAMTSMSVCASTNLRKPSATMPWSSAIRTLIFMSTRHAHGESAPALGQSLHFETPANCLRAFPHRHHAETGLGLVSGVLADIEADSIVPHGHYAIAVILIERDFGVPGAGMLCNVVEGLLRDAKQRDFDLRWRLRCRLAGAHHHRDARSSGEVPRVPLERRGEPVVVEHWRGPLGHDGFDCVHRRLEIGSGYV